MAKIADMNHCKKAQQEKPPTEIIVHIGAHDLSSDKIPKDITKEKTNSIKCKEN